MSSTPPVDSSGNIVYGNPPELNNLADRLMRSHDTLSGQDKDLEVCKAFLEAKLSTDTACSYLSGEDSDVAQAIRAAEPPVFAGGGAVDNAIAATQAATIGIGAASWNVRGFSTDLAGADAQYREVLSQPVLVGNDFVTAFEKDDTVRTSYEAAGRGNSLFEGQDGLDSYTPPNFLGTKIADRVNNFFGLAGAAYHPVPWSSEHVAEARNYFTSLGYTGDFIPAAGFSACAIAGHIAHGTDEAPKPKCEGAQCQPYGDDQVFPEGGVTYPHPDDAARRFGGHIATATAPVNNAPAQTTVSGTTTTTTVPGAMTTNPPASTAPVEQGIDRVGGGPPSKPALTPSDGGDGGGRTTQAQTGVAEFYKPFINQQGPWATAFGADQP